MKDSRELLLPSDFPAIRRAELNTLQLNLGYLCNLSCTHCHVNAGPKRTELMSTETIDLVIELLEKGEIQCLDLTGGAPEMNPEFRRLVRAARALEVTVIDRCNLTILLEPGYEDLAEFLAEQKVEVCASLPCYSEQNVDAQRGKGVFEESIEALQKLNQLGYGNGLPLSLVYNPGGAFLPPPQGDLERDYKRELKEQYGIVFDHLLTITNMPISRFGAVLHAKGEFQNYLQLLKDNFSQDNLAGVMCRQLVSVDWQGNLYDCDFNQMLEMPIHASRKQDALIASDQPMHIRDLLGLSLQHIPIKVAEHCYGCTAGQGSSCSGAL
ncbi:arsenosugar biosynthesis radical SAM (seleno)protein ArsS [Pseudoteredinibacter isoporae]|uniref:Radical SAM/Cys-rich protein n=1 Tax=Pseudoteredinibacter isoporae TaxID=570281 RepID=A0A7X0JWI9_9GAMM|nr:arsenosugar biosynthesis radical SAM (seleno)protein ArsS [Pseudoteredinibacter isoporae]MBB6523507.1 radical SAM/Cys-rich protein [Pseudoteredinibacter isoporae]NHO89016.1 radical SAM/Cys-rich domain protein [Pseudoteredinibacter isoporae]NIB24276.1 radical SAM/Cys-rich domain protein [Pseudoteredinibacter isoporae]